MQKKGLYIVATPIGNLGDFSKRGAETLKFVDFILCEDTRVASKLMQSIDSHKKLLVYNDHNADKSIPRIIDSLKKGSCCALISDAGTPLISDPGYKLVNACIENDIYHTIIPGPCAAIAGLVLSGIASNRFLFDGFADSKRFKELSKINSTIILYESPNRIINTLYKMTEFFGNRTISISREITKIFEETKRGAIPFLIENFKKNPPRGEFVIVISPPILHNDQKIQELVPLINAFSKKMSNKELSEILADYSGISKNSIYNFLLEMKQC